MLGKPPARAAERPWLTARNLIIAGGLVNAVAIVLVMALGERLIPLRVGLILTGLVLALAGVNHRLRNFAEDVEERGITAGYLALGSFVALLAYLASSEGWDSFRLVQGVLVGVGLVAAVLVLMPLAARRAVIVFLVLFHFGGILTAVFSVPPPNTAGCWMTNALWTYIYRPYLQFMYLNNAYHFYSPEPGPATQLWFLVRYEGPDVPPHWVQVPRREDYHSRLSYQRATAMTDAISPTRFRDQSDMRVRIERRLPTLLRIPYHPDIVADLQYREPSDLAKKYIASYARHVARGALGRSPESPEAAVKSVKVYRAVHNILGPGEMAAGMSPDEASKFWVYYEGEFDGDGQLLDGEESGHPDPLLYWAVPIVRQAPPGGEPVLKNYVTVHAGSAPPFLADN